MTDFVGIDVQGMKELNHLLNKLPDVVQDYVVEEVSTYLVNVYQTSQPSPKYVSRVRAYPEMMFTLPSGRVIRGFKSRKQWLYVIMLGKEGKIPRKRTQALRRGWKKVGKGRDLIIANETPGAPYVMGPEQSRHEELVGWEKVDDINEERRPKIEQKAVAAAEKGMRKLGAK